MKKLLIMALATVALVSCTSNEDEGVNSGPVEIKLNAEIVSSVAAKAAINPGQAVTGVQFARIDGASPDWTSISSITLTGNLAAATPGAITLSPTQYYLTDGSTATNLMAYYPAATSLAAGVASMTITGAEDVLYAAPVSGTKLAPITTIQLGHQLTQFTFVVKRDAASTTTDIGNVSIAINDANTTFKMALTDGALSDWATPVNTITPMTAGVATVAGSAATSGIMLEPNMASIDLQVSADGYTGRSVTIAGTDANKFEAGKAYLITLTFKGTSIEFTATIAPWTPGTGGDSDIQ